MTTNDLKIKVPLVHVSVSDGDEQHHRVEYFVDDTMVMDLDVQKEYLPIPEGEALPLMVLTQLFVTPHHHIAALEGFLRACAEMDADGSLPAPIAQARDAALSILSPPQPSPEEAPSALEE